MSRLGFYVLSGVLCSLVVLGQGKMTTQKPIVIPISPIRDPSTTIEPSTEAPTVPITISTEKPTTTTKATTTSSSTTTSTTTTTTPEPPTPPPTPKPTPPTPTPTPTPKPTPPGPLPPPEQGTWSYMENNITCIVVQFAAQLKVTYTVNNTTDLSHVLFNVPSNATVLGGRCATNDSTQWISLTWAVGSSAPSNMTLVFLKNETTKNYALQFLNVSLTPELFPNATAKIELSHGSEWQTPLATSYRCAVPTKLTMAAAANVGATLTLSRLQEEAFRNSPGKGFSAARECGSGDVPDAVPIAVGCALGGLVVVVLVAYLVARRRSHARGYLSM